MMGLILALACVALRNPYRNNNNTILSSNNNTTDYGTLSNNYFEIEDKA